MPDNKCVVIVINNLYQNHDAMPCNVSSLTQSKLTSDINSKKPEIFLKIVYNEELIFVTMSNNYIFRSEEYLNICNVFSIYGPA